VSERAVLLGDHTSVVKDGRKMPGVLSMHEESETQSKPACFCCPLQLQIHQGFTHLGLMGESGSQPQIKSTERMVAMGGAFAESHQRLCYLVLDAFFFSR